MPEAVGDHNTSLTRRALLTGALTMLPAATVAAAPQPDPDAELFAAAEGMDRADADHGALYELLERVGGNPSDAPVYQAAQERMRATGLHFARTPAHTIKGLALKLRHIADDVTLGKTHWAEDLVLGALADARRMAGEG